jgi:hypothetical protein
MSSAPPSQVDSQVKIYNPSNHPSPAPTFSHISEVRLSDTTRLITLAGQALTVSDFITPDGDNLPESLIEQTKLTLANVDKVSCRGWNREVKYCESEVVCG